MMLRNLTILRHGMSEMNVMVNNDKLGLPTYGEERDEIIRTQPDFLHRLSETGIEQAVTVGESLKSIAPIGFDKVYVSPFKRTIETAHHALSYSSQWNIVLDNRLIERDWGDYGRVRRDEAKTLFPFTDAHRSTAPLYNRYNRGESLGDVQLRIRNFIETLHREREERGYENILIVAHGDVMSAFRIILEHWTNDDLIRTKDDPAYNIGNCSLLQYRREVDGPYTNRRLVPLVHTPDMVEWEAMSPRRKFSADSLAELLE